MFTSGICNKRVSMIGKANNEFVIALMGGGLVGVPADKLRNAYLRNTPVGYPLYLDKLKHDEYLLHF